MKRFVTILGILLCITVTTMAEQELSDLSNAIAFQRIDMNLTSVIDTIETISQGTVVEVRYEKADSFLPTNQAAYVFSVESLTDRGAIEYQVAPTDLKVLSKHKDFSPQVRSEEALQHVALSLKEAVIRAQKSMGGRAYSAEIDDHQDRLIHKVRLVKNHQVAIVIVDPTDGEISTLDPDDESSDQ